MTADFKATKVTKADRLAAKIAANLSGASGGQITVRATLTGALADVWRSIKSEGDRIGLDDQGLVAALLDVGGSTLRQALKAVPSKQE